MLSRKQQHVVKSSPAAIAFALLLMVSITPALGLSEAKTTLPRRQTYPPPPRKASPKKSPPPPHKKLPPPPPVKSPPPALSEISTVGGCKLFPANNAWNLRVDNLPVATNSDTLVASIGLTSHLHPDFGSGLYDGNIIGIPYNLVNNRTPTYSILFEYASESDAGPYPIPPAPQVEGGSDLHCLLVNTDTCILHEIYAFSSNGHGGFNAGSGAIWKLSSNHLRPGGWTSADAAGLQILPGLARYEEVVAGRITHALRFTAPRTQKAYQWPARHEAGSSSSPALPPMGLRVRLKQSFNISGFPTQAKIVLRALQQYGMMLADNGSPWYIGGVPNNGWNNDDLHSLQRVLGTSFEVVDMSRVAQYA